MTVNLCINNDIKQKKKMGDNKMKQTKQIINWMLTR